MVAVQSMFFKETASLKLNDPVLQQALKKAKGKFVDKRAEAILELDDFQAVRTHAAALRDRCLANLDAYLLEFEANAIRRGAQVHWAETAEAACEIIAGIARDNGVKRVTKSKSMVSEEIGLNEALEAAGVEAVETDLGEYILQLAGEPPSHIVAPAVHKSKEQVADLFEAAHHKPRTTDIPAMTREAREVLRDKFLSADMGISGANFIIAETGTTLTVTNEGNADLDRYLKRFGIRHDVKSVAAMIKSPDVKGVFEAMIVPGAPKAIPRPVYEAALNTRTTLQKLYADTFAKNRIAALALRC